MRSLHRLSLILVVGLLASSTGCTQFVERSGDDTTPNPGDTRLDTTPADTGSSGDTSTTAAPDATAQPDTTTTPDTTATPDTTQPPDTTPPLPTETPLTERLAVSEVQVPEGVAAGVTNWRIWGRSSLGVAPVFTVPLENCHTLVCYTVGDGVRVAELGPDDALVQVFQLDAGMECRGLAAEPDGHFAALVWEPSSERIWVKRYDTDGNEVWATELLNPDNHPDDFTIGDSRLTYGDGTYGAYYHTHSDSGHEGDTLKWVTVDGTESTGWSWGCSHSMSNLLTFHPGLTKFMPACVTDCYPGTSGSDFANNSRGGVVLNHSARVMDVDGGCNGSVAAELGGAAPSTSGWMLAFNAHQAPATLGQASYDPSSMNQDIALAIVNSSYQTQDIIWLTNTAGDDEADASIAAWTPEGGAAQQFVVGWSEPDAGNAYKLGRIDAAGVFLEAPLDISATARWGRRDDPFRVHVNGDVVWTWFDAPNATVLRFARLRSGSSATCASF